MAKAAMYDSWVDAALTFSTDDLEAWDPEAWAQERVAKLCAMRQLVMRRLEVEEPTKPEWWRHLGKVMRDKITWYCKAVPLVAPTPEELGDKLPSHRSAAGKELSKRASMLDEAGFIGEWGSDAEYWKAYVVTIGRAASAHCKWKKETDKLSNRLANCLSGEFDAAQKFDKLLSAYT